MYGIFGCEKINANHFIDTPSRHGSIILRMNQPDQPIRYFSGFVRTARVSPQKFAKIYRFQKDNVERVRVIPPRLGVSGDFGSIEVSFKVPVNDPELCTK